MAAEEEDQEFEQHRACLRDQVARSSLRAVASRLGMSPSGLQNVLDGARPYGKTREKVRSWYFQQSGLTDVPPREVATLLRRIVGTLSRPERTVLRILEVVEAGHIDQGRQVPRWIANVRAELVARAELPNGT